MLGLNHPGQELVPPKISGEHADSSSLLGRGMILRLPDFQKAFCNNLDPKECGTWKAK
jgi:hypothetical protein